jgi:hypothetical protein
MVAFPRMQFFLFNLSKIYYSGGYQPCQSIRVFWTSVPTEIAFPIPREDYKEGLDKGGKTS